MKRQLLSSLLLGCLSVFCAAVFAEPPAICRVQGGNTKTIWGTGFDSASTKVYVADIAFDEQAARDALKKGALLSTMPLSPPSGAKELKVLAVEPRGLVMAVDFYSHYNAGGFYDARAGADICWVKNSDGYSKPSLVHSAQPWWVYPERAEPGRRIRIFGRNIDAKLVALRPAGGEPLFLDRLQPGRNSLYEVAAQLPQDIQPGEYELFVHNGAGGPDAWGGPLKLTVEKPQIHSGKIIDAVRLGAKANGLDDDTDTLRRALVLAAAVPGTTVYLPPGRYAISKTLWIPSGVTLAGAGPEGSVICVNDRKPMTFDVPGDIASAMPGHFKERMRKDNLGAMVWMRDDSAVKDVGFVDGPGVLHAIFGSRDSCRIERCRMYMAHAAQPAVMVEWGSYGFVLADCTIEAANGAVFLVHGPQKQACIARNQIRNIRPGTANNLFVRSFIDSVIEDNIIADADRNWVSQLTFASSYHSILQGNIWRNNIPRRHNSGENMYEAGQAEWHGKVVSAGPASLTAGGQPFKDKKYGDYFILVLDGPGLGQYRRIKSNTENTLAVETPWLVPPDRTSYVMLVRAYVETLWIDNNEEHTANWTGLWGSNFGNVIDGHVLRDGEGYYFWAWNADSPSPVAFCDLIGSRTIGRGNIRFAGPLVFGNTVRFSEVVDFRYRPSMHIQPTWLQGFDPAERAAVELTKAEHKISSLPPTAPLKDWNIIEANNIYDGPAGITVAADADYNIIRKNRITADGPPITNHSRTSIILDQQ
ncbi:MAG: hypothetical protein JW720_12550 [Sedimentisphaerales bacterium]|nr:hypothetical protein [Sedimentisphaerales bacterium]